MVDTVKLLLNIPNPLALDGSRFEPMSLRQLANARPGARTYLNPSKKYAAMGKYMPNLTMFKRVRDEKVVYQLAIEFSAPKIVYGNNFDELKESDFPTILEHLITSLYELLNYRFFTSQLANADITEWHPSKNVVFLDYTACQTVLNGLSKLDISRRFDVQKTDFREGHVLHIHTNSMDIAFYDKLADMRRAKISPKRAVEKDWLPKQLSLLDTLEEYKPIEIFHYEVRLNGRAAVKRAYPELSEWTFAAMFTTPNCKRILIDHWKRITKSVDMLALDAEKPLELLQNYLADNPTATPQAALAAVAGLLVIKQTSVIELRTTLEAHFKTTTWSRVKKLLKAPTPHRFTYFVHVDEALQRFEPTEMKKFENHIDNTVK